MRVVAGTARGTVLKTPEGMLTRPTADRVKEAVFSILHFDVQDAVVLESINNLEAKGQVKVRGQVWSARSADESVTYAAGEVVRVLSIEGVKLICEKKN